MKLGCFITLKWITIFTILNSLFMNVSFCYMHSSEPLLLLISFDGFRWDYLIKHNLTNFNYLKKNGVYADYIRNAFTTVTFSNHWSMVTGLYEETHGIVQNIMFDPELNQTFDVSVAGKVGSEWYAKNGIVEPIWITNQKAGKSRSSAAEWLATHVVIDNEEIISIPFNKSQPFRDLIDQFIRLFVNETKPINFGAIYFYEPDHTGHVNGPNSKEMSETLKSLDELVGYLIEQLKYFHLFDKLNLIITSDHGMEEVSKNRSIFLDQHIDTSLFHAYGTRSLYNLFLKNESNLELVYNQLKKIDGIDVYKKHEIPDKLHYKNNKRVGPIVIVSKLGYSVILKTHDVNWTITNGDHGYYNTEKSMLPIFIAHGPAFKRDYKSKGFSIVDIYPLMCEILRVKPGTHNGSLENVIDMLKEKPFIETFYIYLFAVGLVLVVIVLWISVRLLYGRKRRFYFYKKFTHRYEKML